MVNGILRSLERSLERLPTIPQRDPVEYLSICLLYTSPVFRPVRLGEYAADGVSCGNQRL